MNAKKAYTFFKKKHPDLVVTQCCLYDGSHYIFTALPKGVESDPNDPFYAVDKKSGEVTYFCPTADLDKWCDAFGNHRVKWE